MSHWAEIDENNVVVRITIGNNDEPDHGYQWLIDNLGGRWIKTSYNAAGRGYTWDESRDAFIPPKCHDEAILDETIMRWICENEAHDAVS